jgi:two-component system OmpR family sensor kinase
MLRLFISLFFVISLGLVLINLSSNALFSALESNIQSDKFSDIESISQVSKGYANLLATNQISISQLKQTLTFDADLIEWQNIGFLPEQNDLLISGQTLNLFKNESELMLFTSVSDQLLLQLGPIKLTSSNQEQLDHWLIFLSYLMLAIFILAWSKPLWRDLTSLIDMTKQVSKGQLNLQSTVPSRSVLSPLSEAMQKMAARITELMSVQKQMVHAVSHDIRTPLARMKFSLALLEKPEPTRQENDIVKNSLLADIGEVESLIDNLLSFAKLENGQINLNQQNVDLVELTANLIEKLKPLSSLTISSQLPTEQIYMCDGHLIERALQNLIVNGQKYGVSQINVSLVQEDKYIKLQIEDDGPGIPQDKLQKVLMPFSRLDQSRNKESGGFGLGLAIVNKIIGWHNGKLELGASNLGGAKAAILLPQQPE